MNYHLLLILAGGLGVPSASFLVARHLVYRHGDPAAADAYFAARRAEQAAAEREALVAIPRTCSDRPKELAR